jgi:hypothetical protein
MNTLEFNDQTYGDSPSYHVPLISPVVRGFREFDERSYGGVSPYGAVVPSSKTYHPCQKKIQGKKETKMKL